MSDTPNRKGFTLWFTGLSGSGKSTLAERVGLRLEHRGLPVEILDEDVVRNQLLGDLGSFHEARDESVKRLGFVCELLTRHGVGVIAVHSSPYREARESLRQSIKNFVEVYTRCPLEVCKQRDLDGFYHKAQAAGPGGPAGTEDPYEPPSNPEVTCKTDQESVEESVEKVIQKLEELGYLSP